MKYCTQCGENIEEKMCACSQKEADASEKKEKFNKAAKEGYEVFNEGKNVALRMIKKPVSTYLEEIKKNNLKLGLGLMATHSLVLGIFFFFIYSMIRASYSALFRISSFGFGLGIKLTFTAIFLGLIQAGSIVGLSLLANKLLKTKAKLDALVTTIGLAYIPSILMVLIAIPLSIISFNLAILAMFFGVVMSFTLFVLGLKEALEVSFDTVIFVAPAVVSVLVIVTFFIGKQSIGGFFRNFLF